MARTHTTTTNNLLEEFNDDQLLLMLEMKGYDCERPRTKKEAEGTTHASIGRMTNKVDQMTEEAVYEPKEEAAQELKEEAIPTSNAEEGTRLESNVGAGG